ncbi:MAG: HlyD family secretion protein [Allosphingosinicella sp.]
MKKRKKEQDSSAPYAIEAPVLLAQPLIDRVLVYFFSAIFGAAFIFAIFTNYSRTETARGEIAAASGFSTVVAEDSAVVTALLVEAGATVRKGQPLAHLTRPRIVSEGSDTHAVSVAHMREALRNFDQQIADTQRAIEATRIQIASVRRGAGISRTAAAERRSLTQQRRSVAMARQNGLEELAREGLITGMAVDRARVESLQLMQEAADAELQLNEIVRGRDDRIAMLESQMRDLSQNALSLRNERISTEKQLGDLQAQHAFTVVAPDDGVVAAIPVRLGQRLEPGQRMFAIAQPSAELTVVLEVPSRAIGLIDEGQRVALKYDAFPFQTYGLRYGTVTRVELASIEGGQPAAAEGQQQQRDRPFLVEVKPEDEEVIAYGRPRPLKVGMMLTADIEVERRSLLSWWLSPLFMLKGRL